MEQDREGEHEYCLILYFHSQCPDVIWVSCKNCNEYSAMPASWQINNRMIIQNWLETHPVPAPLA
jgi:hypothetical protein